MDPFPDSSDETSDNFNISQNGFLWGETFPLFLKVNYDIRKIKMGLSLDEDSLILAVESLVRKIRLIILFGDAHHELQCGIFYVSNFSVIWNGWSRSSEDPCGGSPPANGGLSPHIPNTDPKQDWMLSIPHLPEWPTREHGLHHKNPGGVCPNKRLASHH